MRGLLIRWVVNAIALYVTAQLVGGVSVDGTEAILWAAALLGIANAVIRPVLLILTLPLNILTLGLFTFVINGFMLWLVSRLVSGFEVAGAGAAILGAVVLSIASGLISIAVRD
ncbi:MAG: phage holin family protein [Firmicutes bacterium]|jgi:putative membrane protein|nr:phage holin family protein [Bacillota bacterium]